MSRLFLLIILVTMASVVRAQSGTKLALLVAASHYAPSTGWGDTGAANDAVLLRAALLQQGFTNAHIQVLTSEQATKAGLVAGLRTLAAQAAPGDIVVFSFSGHGQQVFDDNGDETDGLDEALVPTDAPNTYVAGQYEGQRHLRDDELGALLQALRQRLGPRGELLVLLDACHSGTGTRGIGRARGSAKPLAPTGYIPLANKSNSSFGLADATASSTALSPMVCLSGSGPHEMNFETVDDQGNAVGPLSLAFAQAVNSFSTPPSYEALFDRIKAKMAISAPGQSPQLEGAARARLFGGSFLPLPAHYKPVRWLSDQQLVIAGGTLQGLFEQTEVALYPPDANLRTARPLATGQVVASDLNTATLKLNRPLTGSSRLAWVFITARSYGPVAMSLRLALPDQPPKAALLAALAQRPFVRVVAAAPADLTLEGDSAAPGHWQLTTDQGQVVYKTPGPATDAAATAGVLEALGRAAQAHFLRSLQVQAADVRVDLVLLPIGSSTGATATSPARYPAGQYCQLQVTNKGRRDAYFTVLDIQPDNYLHVLLPSAHAEPADYFVPVGQQRLLPDTIRLNPPYGTELFKLISSPQPLDLRDLVDSHGRDQGRGMVNPFARLLALSYPTALGARAVPPALPPAIVNTTELIFIIAKP